MAAGKPPVIIPRSEHTISRKQISNYALKVLYRLHQAGYAAYLVGGCLRDLTAGLRPKDFDIATNASPEEIKALFNNCRLIGRRFRLAHVHFGREVLEVATFRAAATTEDDDAKVCEDSGRVLRDNVYGSLEDDAWRRDFTLNALYYNIADYSIVDHCNGMQDLHDGVVRMIGNPVERYREDPVRMIRAVRFARKLNFKIDPAAEAPIPELAPLLADMPPARMFEEVLKLFHFGEAEAVFEQLWALGLYQAMMPVATVALDEEARRFVSIGLRNTDRRIREDLPVTPAYLFAVMLWPAVCKREAELIAEEGLTGAPALQRAATEISDAQTRAMAIPKRFRYPMLDIWMLQSRMARRGGKRSQRLLEHKRIRAAVDFLELRATQDESLQELASWWRSFVDGDTEAQQKLLSNSNSGEKTRSRTRRKRRRRSQTSTGQGE